MVEGQRRQWPVRPTALFYNADPYPQNINNKMSCPGVSCRLVASRGRISRLKTYHGELCRKKASKGGSCTPAAMQRIWAVIWRVAGCGCRHQACPPFGPWNSVLERHWSWLVVFHPLSDVTGACSSAELTRCGVMKRGHAYHFVADPPWSALSSGRLIFAEQLRQITTNHANSRHLTTSSRHLAVLSRPSADDFRRDCTAKFQKMFESVQKHFNGRDRFADGGVWGRFLANPLRPRADLNVYSRLFTTFHGSPQKVAPQYVV